MGERVPQHVQNIVIRDYCTSLRLRYLLSVTEYVMEDCHLILENVLDELSEVDGVVMYSLFQLPRDPICRNNVYKRILAANKTLHFAVEGLRILNQEDVSRVENIWNIRNILPLCLQPQGV